jgi:hypothetical protein
VARFGNTVVTHNNMTEALHKDWISELASQCNAEKDKINALIEKIKEKLALVDPLYLFNYLTTKNTMMLMSQGVISEIDIADDINFQLRSVEYVQSLLVSMDHNKANEIDENEQEDVCHEIANYCLELYSKMPMFYMYWAAQQQKMGNLSLEDEEYIVFAQMMSQVRGEQYQAFRIPILKELLLPQEVLLKEIYGLSVDDVIAGLTVLEKNLSSGRLDAMKDLSNQMDKLALFEGIEPDDNFIEESREVALKVIGTTLFEVKENTAWSNEFIDDLCLGINSDKSFLSHKEFSGWPIWNLPIQYKPFIKIDGKTYCFDYYNLFDNFYVALQRAIRNHGKEYGDRWNNIQGYSSERLVGGVFESLLPGCKVHYSNYYPLQKKDIAENDILIEYKDVLLVVEVKAGTFVYTPAMMDFQAHKKSFKTLVEKAENQCIRAKNYITDGIESKRIFYTDNSLDTEAFYINRDKYNQIYLFDVTVSDFNEFASQMEKIKIAKTHEGIIAISLNDLWVYKYYFDNPLQFIHFIKQRTIATETMEIATSDELDHLGMYISHNMYSLQAKDIGQGRNVYFMGYREELDKYFSSIHIGLKYEKPMQYIPFRIVKILEIIINREDKVTQFSNYLLDLSSEGREEFDKSISNLARRERELGRMLPAMSFMDCSYALFAEVPDISLYPYEKREEYILANLVQNGRKECWSITIILDKEDNIIDVHYHLFNQSDIPDSRRDKLKAFGKEIVERRTEQFLMQNGKKKIYPNEPCICGSGKKYKRCCGRS